MTIMLLVLEMIPNSKASSFLVLRAGMSNDGDGAEENIGWKKVDEVVKEYTKYHKEKSRIIKNRETEIIYEVKTSQEESLLKALREVAGLAQINYLAHDGEYRI